MAIQDKFNKPNVIYKITKDIDLGGGTLTIPEGCTLDFQGGSFSNGTIVGNETAIKAGLSRLFGENIDIKGNWNIENAFLEWFGVYPDAETDCTKEFQKAINTFKNILISNGTYNVSKLEFLYDSEIKGSVGDCTIRTTEGIVVRTHNNFLMEGINVYGNDNTECVIDVYDNFGAKFDRVSIGGGKIGIRFDASEHSYYNNISRSSISGSKIGIMFTHNSNANTVLENRFYQCETCIVIDSCNGNRIMCNTFQDFTLCGIRLEYNDYGSITRANFIAANYFEANQTDTYSDIDFTSNPKCTNNTVIGNNFTYKTGNLHIANNEGGNVILDSSGATYNEVFFQLLGGVLKIPTLSSSFTSTYGGDKYKSCLSYIQKNENNTALLASLMDSEGQYWAEVLTKNRKGQTYLPSIQTELITQFFGGKIELGVDGSLSERALTFKSGYGIIQYGYSNKWHYLQPISCGGTRPFVDPFLGYCHFDTTLNKPIWWTGSKWVDATGAEV